MVEIAHRLATVRLVGEVWIHAIALTLQKGRWAVTRQRSESDRREIYAFFCEAIGADVAHRIRSCWFGGLFLSDKRLQQYGAEAFHKALAQTCRKFGIPKEDVMRIHDEGAREHWPFESATI